MNLPFFKKKTNVLNYTHADKQADDYLGMVLNTLKSAFGRGGGSSFGMSPNGKRNYNELFGYGDQLDYQDYKGMYERGGYANVIVSLFPKLCWRDIPEIKVGDDVALKDELIALKKAGFFSAMEKADIANRIGRFSVLFIGVPDGMDPSLPIGSANKGDFKGMYFNVYEEDGIEVVKYDTDPASPRFNLPELYTLQVLVNGDSKLQGNVTARTVHYSRVVHLAEGALSSRLEGVSSLKAPWNALIDKNKVRGSSAEAYYRNARQKLSLETANGAKSSGDTEARKALKENVENFQNGFEDTLRLNNMTANMLQPGMVSPRDSFDVSTEDAAGTSGIPVRYLTTKAGGTVTGSEDKAALNGRVMDRQDQECTLWLLDALKIMDNAGILELPENAEVTWPVQSSLSEKEASESSKNKADAFKAVADGLSTVGADEVLAESAFKAVGLEGIETDDIDLSVSDDNLDKTTGVGNG